MESNDLNRRVRYALMLDDADVSQILSLAGLEADMQQITGWRLKEGQEGYIACPAEAVRAMLDGLIIQRRGPREDSAGAAAATGRQSSARTDVDGEQLHSTGPRSEYLDNNEVLKQLRIALSLKTDDVYEFMKQGGGKLGKSEVNALFRKPSARNYRRCGDQVLRWFLAGLASGRSDNPS